MASTALDRLRAELAMVSEQRDTLERRIDELEAAIAECEGDALRAAWRHARARGENEEGHRLWVQMMARSHLERGDAPAISDHCAQEIADEMERQRAEARHGA